mgnify:CR=1 FL=1
MRVWLSLGSNIDRERNIRSALRHLGHGTLRPPRGETLAARLQRLHAGVREVVAPLPAVHSADDMRKVIALRKRDANDLAEEEAMLDLYKTALGM